jgi:hypothetical protein
MYMRQNADATLLLESPNSVGMTLPPHLQSAFFPTSTVHAVVIGPHLIGTTFSFLDGKSGEIMKCTVQDYGTSQLRGDWVEVISNDTTELRISPEEMKDMLANRVA